MSVSTTTKLMDYHFMLVSTVKVVINMLVKFTLAGSLKLRNKTKTLV